MTFDSIFFKASPHQTGKNYVLSNFKSALTFFVSVEINEMKVFYKALTSL